MPLDFDLGENFADHSRLVNDERAPHDPHERPAIEFFFLPDAVLVHHLLIDIADQGKRQIIFFDEFLMSCSGVDTDAEDFRVFELFGMIAKIAGFGGATGGHVFGIEIKDDVLLALEGAQFDFIPVLISG